MKNVITQPFPIAAARRRLFHQRGTVVLETRGLRPGVYYYTQWAGAVKGERGTLVVQP